MEFACAESPDPGGSHPVSILVVDDSRLQRALLMELLRGAGYQVIAAENGEMAVETFVREKPDMVIMDIIMPVMDGIQATEKIRALSDQAGYVPIVFVTEADSGRYLEQCVAAGGDDFIPKPVNSTVLNAKIRSLLRIRRHSQEQFEQQQLLLKYQQQVAREQEVAAAIYERSIQAGFMESPNLKFLNSAMSSFNGDVLLSGRTPSGSQNILLGDFTGHGLIASLGVAPAAEVFYGMTAKGFGVRQIALEINRKLKAKLPVDMFFGACFVSLDPLNGRLEICTGGLPDHYLCNAVSGEIRVIESNNLPLGIVQSDQLDLVIHQFDVGVDDWFYMFSDGVIEAEDAHGRQFGAEAVLGCLKPGGGGARTGFDHIVRTLDRWRQDLAQSDDMTLVELNCDPAAIGPLAQDRVAAMQTTEVGRWEFQTEFDAPTLKQVNPVPTIMHGILEMPAMATIREPLFRILSELFTNALEYGVLQLDSSVRQQENGVDRYYALKQERLDALDEGSIRISVAHTPQPGGGELTVIVEDSGPGFDSSCEVQTSAETDCLQGIGMLLDLCRSLEYSGRGNSVRAVYQWTAVTS